MLKAIADSDPDLGLVASDGGRDPGFDALVVGANHMRLGIEIKAARNMSHQAFQRIAQQVATMQERFGVQRMLVVFRDPPTPGALAMFFRYPVLSPVFVTGPDDVEVLHSAIRNALGLDGAGR
ncbi:MAG: hypothetical protein JWN95_216 [Frankiales bacterium]|nr:hypothetical protein [Frankiales bacterium]